MNGNVDQARLLDTEDVDEPDARGHEEQFVQLVAILDRDGGLMPANREHALWGLWKQASGAAGTPGDVEAFRAAYAAWLAQKPIVLK